MKIRSVAYVVLSTVLFTTIIVGSGEASDNLSVNDMGFQLPVGGGYEEPDYELCPVGVRVVQSFLYAWRQNDYRAMYELLDEDSKKNYSFDQAIFDFKFLEYRNYEISTIKKQGDNFEFIISSGNWQEGDKNLKKMIISGKSNKIVMAQRNSPFKRSAEEYF